MATYGQYNTIPGLTAAANLAAQQYKVVKFSAAGTVNVVTAATDNAIGILQNDPTSGQAAEVAYSGIAIAIAGVNDLAVGEYVGFNTTAQVKDTTTDNTKIIGQALDASTAVGDEVRVLLFGGSARY